MSLIDPYAAFIAGKAAVAPSFGIETDPTLPGAIKPFQGDLVYWALRRGRAAIFANTGLGKTLMELAWSDAIAVHTGKPVLLLTPLAVAQQTVEEAAKFRVSGAAYCRDMAGAKGHRIVVTNYDIFDHFDLRQFGGIVLDESSILKAHEGKMRAALTEACQAIPYRLACTATPAPNDWVELGNHAEFLGVGSQKEMLSMFFVHDGSVRAGGEEGEGGWRLKGHGQRDFWQWVASWAAFVRHPRDLGYEEPGYDLPPLRYHDVTVKMPYAPTSDSLFPMEARTMSERISARRDSIPQRVAAAVSLVESVIEWPERTSRTEQHPDLQKKNEPTIKSTTDPTRVSGTRIQPKNSAMPIMQDGENNITETQNSKLISGHTINAMPNPGSSGVSGSRESSASLKTDTPSFCECKEGGAGSAESVMPTPGGTSSTLTTAMIPVSSGACSAHHATSASANSETTPISSIAPSNISSKPAGRWLIWCGLNDEQDAIADAFGDQCISIYGSLPPDEKVRRLWSWLRGERPILVTKVSICGFGINMQACSRMIFVGLNDSFEGVFQAVRRCWRFGQTQPVDVYMVASEFEGAVVANIKRKEAQHEAMGAAMAEFTLDLTVAEVRGYSRAKAQVFKAKMEMPAWLS